MGVKHLFSVAVMAVLLTACGTKSNMESFLRDEVDLSAVTKVAVLPFENHSKEQFAAERIRGMAITQILAKGLFDVVDKGLVDSALREEAVDLSKAPMDAATMKRLGQRLGVQALMLGAIEQAGVVQRGNTSYPELSITLRLLDINSGMIFWQASGNRSGESMGKRLFGFSSDDDFKIALKLLGQILATISAEQKVKLPTPAAVPAATSATDGSVQPIAPQDGSGAEAMEAEAPAEGEEGLDAPLDQGEDMGLDEALRREDEPPLEDAGLEGQEMPAEDALPPALEEPPAAREKAEEAPLPPAEPAEQGAPVKQVESAAPSPPPPATMPAPAEPVPAPVAAPPKQQGEQAWPE